MTGALAHEGDHGQPGPAPEHATVTEGSFYPMGGEGSTVFGSAKLVRHDAGSDLTVHVHGLAPETRYPMHLHAGTCAEMGPHYRNDPQGPAEPPNELWPTSDPDDPKAGVTSDEDGIATGRGHAPWKARPEARSVMIHNSDTGRMVACADLS
jgi:hypothetical protein